MFKKVRAFVFALGIVCCGLVFTSIESNAAADFVFYLNYPEPAVSSTQGYLQVLLRNTYTGEYNVGTFFWNTVAVNSAGVQVPVVADINISSDQMVFNLISSGTVSSVYYNLYEITVTPKYVCRASKTSGTTTYRYADSGWYAQAWKCSGNANVNGIANTINFDAYFNSNGYAELLERIILLLNEEGARQGSIQLIVNSILNSVDTVEQQLTSVISYLQSVDSELDSIKAELQLIYQKADALLLEQKVSNTWLEKIFNFLEEKDEKDKEAATQQGNKSTADIDDMIQDDSAGFSDSLGGLTSSMSYTGTNCSWTFPTVKLPAISGVMDEVTLVQEKEIDFSFWVNSIPSGILLLIQSVCTAALIVFCFKELYGTVEYALTLRKGGGS